MSIEAFLQLPNPAVRGIFAFVRRPKPAPCRLRRPVGGWVDFLFGLFGVAVAAVGGINVHTTPLQPYRLPRFSRRLALRCCLPC
eukprot:957030-Pyramimonas_sp.AAC.1